jgi:hypothetical protein
VALFLIFGGNWLADLSSPLRAAVLFLWLFAAILWCAFGVVEEADHLAELDSILSTLETMLPSAAASYRQVLADVQETNRRSCRGTAAELREVVREVLDHLAPDADVTNAPGFKLEPNLKGPSMKQKVRFILRARKTGDSARQTAEDSVQHLDDNVGSIGRAVYARGSTDVHTLRPLKEIRNFKLYADAVLGELLAIHRPAAAEAERVPRATQEARPATAAQVTLDKKDI